MRQLEEACVKVAGQQNLHAQAKFIRGCDLSCGNTSNSSTYNEAQMPVATALAGVPLLLQAKTAGLATIILGAGLALTKRQSDCETTM